eukprot:g27158.t1
MRRDAIDAPPPGMDVHGSGTLDLDEWLRVLRGPLSPARAAVAEVTELLRGMDVHGSGTLDLDEWLRVLRGPLSPARAAVAFRQTRDGPLSGSVAGAN